MLVSMPVWYREFTISARAEKRLHDPFCVATARKTSNKRDPELSMGPLCVTRSEPTHQLTDPTQPNKTNIGAYTVIVTYFYTQNLSRTFSQPSINLFIFVTVSLSLKNKLFKEMFKMSSTAFQQASTKAPSHKLSCWTRPNATHQN